MRRVWDDLPLVVFPGRGIHRVCKLETQPGQTAVEVLILKFTVFTFHSALDSHD